jgi:hypothetical protein
MKKLLNFFNFSRSACQKVKLSDNSVLIIQVNSKDGIDEEEFKKFKKNFFEKHPSLESRVVFVAWQGNVNFNLIEK